MNEIIFIPSFNKAQDFKENNFINDVRYNKENIMSRKA